MIPPPPGPKPYKSGSRRKPGTLHSQAVAVEAAGSPRNVRGRFAARQPTALQWPEGGGTTRPVPAHMRAQEIRPALSAEAPQGGVYKFAWLLLPGRKPDSGVRFS